MSWSSLPPAIMPCPCHSHSHCLLLYLYLSSSATLCPPALLPNCTKRLAPLVVIGCASPSPYTPPVYTPPLYKPSSPSTHLPPSTSPASLPFFPALSLSNVNLSLCPLLRLPLWHLPQHDLRPAVLHLTESYWRRYKLLYGGRGAATWQGKEEMGQAQRSILQGK